MNSPQSIAMVLGSVLAVIFGLAACGERTTPARDMTSQLSATPEVPEEGPDQEQEYLSFLVVGLEEAIQRAAFDVKLPDHAAASRANIVAVYLQPNEEAVILRFPQASPPQSPVRLPYIEIYEGLWAGGDAAEAYTKDLINSPAVGEKLVEVEGLPALGQEAHSPTDETGENPAFLKFVLDGVEVRIHGGESLELLMEVARSIVDYDQSHG